MDNTRATIRINALRCGFGALYAVLALIALLNIFFTLTPVTKSNDQIDERLQKAALVPPASRPAFFTELMTEQSHNLERRPSEPYGWSRLAWLYLAAGNSKAAFAALRMSDLVSPYEAPQLPERAFMWYRLRNVENADQQAYQPALWEKAYGMRRDDTWKLAMQNNLIKEVGASLKTTAPAFYEEWKAREAARH